jgi:protein-L-isoaspartate(D-aspartate) O-methyltransferase
MDDPYRESRHAMVSQQIQSRGVRSTRVLEVLRSVPRHCFVPDSFVDEAYKDKPLPIGHGQTISQPYMVASMTEAAEVGADERVLEVGTGSGYQTAILALLADRVFSVERVPELASRAESTLKELGYCNVTIRIGDGSEGWISEAPFNVILVTAGAPQVPQPLVDQLDDGGRLVIPVENSFSQVLTIVCKVGDKIREVRRERCSFVPLIGKHGWPDSNR